MKTTHLIIVSLLMCLSALAGLPTPEEEIAALKSEYGRREAAAVRPVKDWLSLELLKKEKAFLAAGKSEAAAMVARERMSMLLCSTAWTWNAGPKGEFVLRFSENGTATLVGPKNHALQWSTTNWTVTLKMDDGRKAILTFDPVTLKYSGDDFSPGKVSGSAKL